jgi:uncharacterized membrane protein
VATTSAYRRGSSWFRAKTLLFACIALMMAYVIVHNESFLIDRADGEWEHIESFKWWLLVHGTAGACALLLAPLQFIDWLRTKFTRMHRIVGWIYIGAVFVLAPIGDYIQYLDENLGATRSFTIATTVDAVLLMTTTAVALYFILNRKLQQHRQWMTRSYAVALVFFEVRLISGVLGLDDNNVAGEVIIWICLVMAVPMADVVLQVQESWRARPPAGA